ncbi:MAG: cyclophilin-like fold protein [Candidatus Bathyarchaeota archaeon]|nr:cyclophilin-like fold protein [Candidatus Termiticorpusculum sp.]
MSNEGDISRVRVKFTLEKLGEAEGELVRFKAPRTVDMIVRKLPIASRIALYKEEVYFEIPIKMGEEKAKSTVEMGAIAFWPMSSALCIFYGTSQPYSPVSILGKITKNLELFKNAKSGTTIKVELLPNVKTENTGLEG